MKQRLQGTLRLLAIFGLGLVLTVLAYFSGPLLGRGRGGCEGFGAMIIWYAIIAVVLYSQGFLWGIVLPLVVKMPQWHLVAAVAALVAAICCVGLQGPYSTAPVASGFEYVLVQVLCACIPAFILRAIGFRLINDTNDTQPLIRGMLLSQGAISSEPTDEERRRFQFSLRTLFSWTSALAVLFSTFSVLSFSPAWPRIVSEFSRSEGLLFMVFMPFVMSPFCLWLVFWDKLLKWRVLAFLLANATALIVIFFGRMVLLLNDPFLIVLSLPVELILLFWLFLVRASGFRLRRTAV